MLIEEAAAADLSSNVSFAHPFGSVLARSDRSVDGKTAVTESLATDYTSLDDKLVLVVEIGCALGLSERKTGSDELTG